MKKVNFEQFADNLDVAMQAHLEWSRRILQCAVLKTSPGDDALKKDAHSLCQFGHWLEKDRDIFITLDNNRTSILAATHKTMHDAIRNICSDILNQKVGKASDLECYETAQIALYKHISYFKNLAIKRSSKVDSLTGLPLRHYMNEDFEALTKLALRTGNKIGIVLLDIDNFKIINDIYGHTAGDVVIQYLAEVIKKSHRKNDFIYRYGGEEFLLLMNLFETDIWEEIDFFANRFINTIRNLRVPQPNKKPIQFTVTLGISIALDGESLKSSIERADAELYKGKNSGRDCYMIAR